MILGQFQLRRDVAATWTSVNPVLLAGEMGLETDTQKFKIGDGSTAWNSLAYATQGMQGLAGPQGATGIQGAAGVQGSTGAGSQGTSGIQGIQGIQGSQIQGTTGIQGIQGIQGFSGIQGNTGGQGIQGLTGNQGIQGPQGAPAVPGSTAAGELVIINNATSTSLPTQNAWVQITAGWSNGDVNSGFTPNASAGTLTYNSPAVTNFTVARASVQIGNANETYEIGIFKNGAVIPEHISQFAAASTAEFSVSLSGVDSMATSDVFDVRARCTTRGTTSLTVLQANLSIFALSGATGPQGITGTQGIVGNQGTQGIQGSAGNQGVSGIQGFSGIQGSAGSQGTAGVQGNAGIQGNTGLQGVSGIQGLTGIQGTTGIQGITGIQGTAGGSGIQGTTGIQGSTGPTGGVSVLHTFSTTTTAPPSAGQIRFNNATFASITHIFISYTDRNSVDITNFVNLMGVGTNIDIVTESNVTQFATFSVTAVSAQSGYLDATVTPASGVVLGNTANIALGYSLQGIQGIQGTTGNQGTTGSQGIQGLQGRQGTTGNQGTQGIQGKQGTTGSQGPQGPTSDIRLKRDIRPYPGGVQEVLGIQTCVFKWNGLYDTQDTGKNVIGLIANQLQEIIPEAVYALKGKLRPTDLEETDILHYDLTPVVMAALNAIKEHSASINDLHARVARLEHEHS